MVEIFYTLKGESQEGQIEANPDRAGARPIKRPPVEFHKIYIQGTNYDLADGESVQVDQTVIYHVDDFIKRDPLATIGDFVELVGTPRQITVYPKKGSTKMEDFLLDEGKQHLPQPIIGRVIEVQSQNSEKHRRHPNGGALYGRTLYLEI